MRSGQLDRVTSCSSSISHRSITRSEAAGQHSQPGDGFGHAWVVVGGQSGQQVVANPRPRARQIGVAVILAEALPQGFEAFTNGLP